eukprot:TRINITY_DN20022_c0_g1_i1.p1 TRINITY_DN20022_c0_g1~~TRINITY_DN20022_c0_g1_i1.p1  ORF type:complete len:500 (+),score=78.30 TRINITY_DN20022_c0_g1_i1:39-1538(+)
MLLRNGCSRLCATRSIARARRAFLTGPAPGWSTRCHWKQAAPGVHRCFTTAAPPLLARAANTVAMPTGFSIKALRDQSGSNPLAATTLAIMQLMRHVQADDEGAAKLLATGAAGDSTCQLVAEWWLGGDETALRQLEAIADSDSKAPTASLARFVSSRAAQAVPGAQAGMLKPPEKPATEEQTVKWLIQSAQDGYAPSIAALGVLRATGAAGVERDDNEAVRLHQSAAELGYATALGNIGLCHTLGLVVEQDDAKAVEYFRRSAEQGSGLAQFHLAMCYEEGRGTNKDDAQAVRWYKRAAAQDIPKALHALAVRYYAGDGVPKDGKQALNYCQRAATLGEPAAVHDLGLFHDAGVGVQADPNKAFAFFLESAEQEYPPAMFKVAHCYDSGTGVEADPKQAAQWYLRAAELGYPRAMFNYGVCLLEGSGVEVDEPKAVEWFARAAETGLAIAAYNLAACHEEGIGTPVNKEAALKWYQQAASLGSPDAKNRLAELAQQQR